ncbi:hypothetical protein ACFFRR_011464 [Megaselia abdita]
MKTIFYALILVLLVNSIKSYQDFENCNVGFFRAHSSLSDLPNNCPKPNELFRLKMYSAYQIYLKVYSDDSFLRIDCQDNKMMITSSHATCKHTKSCDTLFKASQYMEVEIALKKGKFSISDFLFYGKFVFTDGLLFFLTPGYDHMYVCDTKVTFESTDLKVEIGHNSDKKFFYYDCPFRESFVKSAT